MSTEPTLTILFDLDDTLLINDFDRFLPVYLKKLGARLAAFVDPQRMVPQLMKATQAMTDKITPVDTLEAVFDRNFYPPLGLNKADLSQTLLEFYGGEFNELRYLTAMQPTAPSLVRGLLEAGHTLAITTNPLFPAVAIQNRIDWAGLSAEKQQFSLITSYEHLHFAKPNPEYFAESLGRLGWPQQPTLMVGNSWSEDLQPTAVLGLPGFLVTQPGSPTSPPVADPTVPHGPLSEVNAWIRSHPGGIREQEALTPRSLLAVLRSTPAVLDGFFRQSPHVHWNQPNSQEKISPVEIFCHLRDVDREVNISRVHDILTTDHPFIAGVDTDRWASTRNYSQEEPSLALQGMLEARVNLISQLETLPADAWLRPGTHSIFGKTTLTEMVSLIADHDKTHIAQLFRMIQ